MITELIKDEVPVRGKIDKTLEKEKQMQIRFAVTKLIKTWYEIRDVYLSSSRRKELIKTGKFNSEMKSNQNYLRLAKRCHLSTESSLKQIMLRMNTAQN